jgi:hypothetical protein
VYGTCAERQTTPVLRCFLRHGRVSLVICATFPLDTVWYTGEGSLGLVISRSYLKVKACEQLWW